MLMAVVQRREHLVDERGRCALTQLCMPLQVARNRAAVVQWHDEAHLATRMVDKDVQHPRNVRVVEAPLDLHVGEQPGERLFDLESSTLMAGPGLRLGLGKVGVGVGVGAEGLGLGFRVELGFE